MTLTFTDCIADDARRPVWLAEFEGRGVRLASGPIAAATADYSLLIDEDGVDLGAVSVDLLEGTAQIGQATVTLSDLGRRVSDLLAMTASGLAGTTASIKLGFAGLDESLYQTQFRGVLSTVRLLSNHHGYQFVFSDALTFLRRQVFRAATSAAPVTLTGNPITLLLQVLVSSGVASQHGPYDVLAAANGLNLVPATWIDVSAIEAERDAWAPAVSFTFTFQAGEDCLAWAQREICKILGCTLYVSPAGLLSLRFVRPVALPSTSEGVTDAEMTAPLDWGVDVDRLTFNQVVVRWDYNATTGRYAAAATFDNTDLQAWHGRVLTRAVDAQGITTAGAGAQLAADIAARLFSNQGYLQAQIAIKTNLKTIAATLGGTLLVSARTVPATLLNARQVREGNINPEYFGVSPRYGSHPPAGMVDYADQNDRQKLAYWSIASSATGLMPNGEAPYLMGQLGGVDVNAKVDGCYAVSVQIVSRRMTVGRSGSSIEYRGYVLDGSTRVGLHPPAGTPDFTSASAADKAAYWFVSSAATGLMPDGSQPYVMP